MLIDIYRSIVLLVFKINQSSLPQIITFLLKCYIVRASLCAQCTVRLNKPKVWSRERFIAGPCKETGDLCSPKSRTP